VTDPKLLEVHDALRQAVRNLEAVTGSKVAFIQVLEDGDLIIAADFETEDEAESFMTKAKGGMN
jgi:hypothetical protein